MFRTVSTGALPLVCVGFLAGCSILPETTRQATELPGMEARTAASVPGGASGASRGFRQVAPHAVAFAPGSSELTPFASYALAEQAHWLMRHRGSIATVTGYADSKTETGGRDLARTRARVAADYLVALGVPRHMIRAVTGNAASVFGPDGHMRLVVTDIAEENDDGAEPAGSDAASAAGGSGGSGSHDGSVSVTEVSDGGGNAPTTSGRTSPDGGGSATDSDSSTPGNSSDGTSSGGNTSGGSSSGSTSGGNTSDSGSPESTSGSSTSGGSAANPPASNPPSSVNNNGNGQGRGSQSNAGRGNGSEGSDPGNSVGRNQGGDDD